MPSDSNQNRDSVGSSQLCRKLRLLRIDGYNKSNREIHMRIFMKSRVDSQNSRHAVLGEGMALSREKDRANGRLVSECLAKKDWLRLEKTVRGMRQDAAETLIAKLRNSNRQFRDKFFYCGRCSHFSFVKHDVDGINLCNGCNESSEVTTAGCGHRTITSYSVCVHETESPQSPFQIESRCRSCCSRFFYWECDGMNHNVAPPPVLVGNYHSSRDKIRRIGSEIPGLPDVGFELEWGPVGGSDSKRDAISHQLLEIDEIVAGVEHDGSVASINGAEIVTHYGSLDVILSGAAKICKVLRGIAISHNTNCCGLHVSISRKYITNYDIARFVVFWNNPKNTRFLVCFARRWNSQYCSQNFDKGNYKIPNIEGNISPFVWTGDNRYEIVNLCNRHRVEVRAFRGTTNKETLRRCISLCAWTMAYCKEEKNKSLHYSAFLEWCKTAKRKRGRRQFRPSDILAFAKDRGFLDKKSSEPPPIEGFVEAPAQVTEENPRHNQWQNSGDYSELMAISSNTTHLNSEPF